MREVVAVAVHQRKNAACVFGLIQTQHQSVARIEFKGAPAHVPTAPSSTGVVAATARASLVFTRLIAPR